MKRSLLVWLLVGLADLVDPVDLVGGVAHAGENPWAAVETVAPGAPQAIGGTSNGCLDGGATLPLVGKGYRVMIPGRHRNHGHPYLVAAVMELAEAAKRERLGLLGVGDLGQPRGGPAPSGHASHQTGLDADLWYVVDGKDAPSLVDRKTLAVTAHFGPAVVRLVRLAASDPRVDRIFVHPSIKRAMCAASTERAWLRRVRPWWGHDHHFHVRLACPPDSPACVAQEPLPPGDGCDELAWWFDESAQAERAEQRKAYQGRVGAKPPLPQACATVLSR